MTKKEMILEAIESLGYKPHVDDDGDICVRFQMKNMRCSPGEKPDGYSLIIKMWAFLN